MNPFRAAIGPTLISAVLVTSCNAPNELRARYEDPMRARNFNCEFDRALRIEKRPGILVFELHRYVMLVGEYRIPVLMDPKAIANFKHNGLDQSINFYHPSGQIIFNGWFVKCDWADYLLADHIEPSERR